MRLALYQPDIPQNMGAIIRIAACFRVPVDVIEPCGFPFDERRLLRTAMDYGEACELVRHQSWSNYITAFRQSSNRLVLMTTASDVSHADFIFQPTDTLMLGRESHGVPSDVHQTADHRIRIPIAKGLRSLNVSGAGAIALAEAPRHFGEVNGKTEL